MGARIRIFKKDILKDYKTKLSRDHKADKQLILLDYFCTRLARSVTYIYTVRGLKESLNIHHSTIKKAIDRFVHDSIFTVENLGQQKGYSLKYNSEILEQDLDESYNPYTIDHTNKIQSKINWIDHTDIVCREVEIEQIKKEVKKRKSIILLGDSGVGKTAILQKLYYEYNQNQNIIYGNFGDNYFKDFLISIAYSLFHQYQNLQMHYFEDKKIDLNSCEWRDIKKSITTLKIGELFNIIINSIQGKDYILMIDHLEKLKPAHKSYLYKLMDYSCVIGATWMLNQNKHVADIWFGFVKIKIKPFDKKRAEDVIELYYKKLNIKTTHPIIYKKKILSITHGSPSAIVNCLKNHSLEPLVNRQDIREIQSPQSVREFDMSFVFLFLIAAVVASRFLALGVGNRTLYVFAGVSGALFQVFRIFLIKTRTNNS